jgi:tetratricopeptide (TPR) repeat protein
MVTIEAVFQQALSLHQAGRLAQAEEGYRAVLTEQPVHADTLHLLGVLLHQTGRSDKAIVYIEGAIRLESAAAQYHNNLGNVLRDLGRMRDAVPCYGKAIRLQPNLADAHHNLGRAQAALGEKKEAEQAFRRALRSNAGHFDALIDLAGLLRETARPADALAYYEAALRIRQNDPLALNNLGLALIDLGRRDDAAEKFNEALRHHPEYTTARFNLGRVLAFERQRGAAAACFEEVLRLTPSDAQAHFSLGELRLINGEFEHGWPELELGRKAAQTNQTAPQVEFPPATWNGEQIGDRLLIVYVDQGFGDAIQFCRYIRFCGERARIEVVAPKALSRLLSKLGGISDVVLKSPSSGSYLHCAISSLPRIFCTTLATIPNAVPYLSADTEQVAAWRSRLAQLPGLKVGLVWAGNPAYLGDRSRSIALPSLSLLAEIPGVALVSLQKGDSARQIRTLRPKLKLCDWTDELSDFADTAALIEALDLVVGVDTAVVHLAGALGKPVWLLNRFDTDWRWMLDRDDSPWYPTLRQFRQPEPGDWASVIAQVHAELTSLAAGRGT